MTQITHNLIAETAQSIAREAYESIAHSNDFYAAWPDRERFVAQNWSMFVQDARTALLKILAGDYPEAMKQPIYEAMLIDGELKHDHGSAAQMNRHQRRAKLSGARVLH